MKIKKHNKGEQMQDFTNTNQQPTSADNFYRDPLEAAPAPQEAPKEAEKAPEPVKEEPPILNQDPEAAAEVTHHEEVAEEPVAPEPAAEPEAPVEELSPELVEYLDTTKKLLEKTRKERNNLIVRMDEEEDSITQQKKENEREKASGNIRFVKYDALNDMRDALYKKNDLINALISVIRTLDN